MWQGLILGLSNGTVCLVSCTPIILPYMLGTGKTVRNNFSDLALFLTGRISGYICFGILAWYTRQLLFTDSKFRGWIIGVATVVLGVAMIFYNRSRKRRQCDLQRSVALLRNKYLRNLGYYPWLFGLITGINICPPFLLAFSEALNTGSLLQSMLFFGTFSIGTSLLFIPFPFLGVWHKNDKLKTLGELTLYLIAGYYIVKGLISLGSGW